MLALIPIKKVSEAKRRLATMLTDSERSRLSQVMAADVLKAVCQASSISRVVVCAGDSNVDSLTEEFGAELILEKSLGCCGLNEVVNELASRFRQQGVAQLVVFHADIPHITAGEIDEITGSLWRSDIAIAPDRRRSGTNILGWHLDQPFASRFGKNSLQRHQHQARVNGLSLQLCELPGASLDLDTPEDLQALRYRELDESGDFRFNHTTQFLTSIDLEQRLCDFYQLNDIHRAAN